MKQHYSSSQQNNQLGFTLLELMVAVAIIAILTAIGAVTYTTIQSRGRDVRRISDMKAIQSAQEQFFSQRARYSLLNISTNCQVDTILSGVTDPQGVPYTCVNNETVGYTGYCACADVEDADRGNADSCDCSAATGCTINAGTDLYCVVNLQ
jgi:prepilin-type N-terminal cleavage/methylation domain-containing protein